MRAAGRQFHFSDPKLEHEIENLYNVLNRKIVASNLNLEDVARAIAQAIRWGQMPALQEFIEGKHAASAIVVQSGKDEQLLKVLRTASGTQTDPCVFFASEDDNNSVVQVTQYGDSRALTLDGLWAGNPILYLNGHGGGGRFVDSSVGAYLSNGGAWTPACSAARKLFFPLTWTELEALEKICALPIRPFEYLDENHMPSGEKHIGPTRETFESIFGFVPADLDLASLALLGVQFLVSRLERIEARLAALEK